jgi:hypothetical protein
MKMGLEDWFSGLGRASFAILAWSGRFVAVNLDGNMKTIRR